MLERQWHNLALSQPVQQCVFLTKLLIPCLYTHTHTHKHTHIYLCVFIDQFSHSVMSDSYVTSWTAACQASWSITNSWRLFILMSIELVYTHTEVHERTFYKGKCSIWACMTWWGMSCPAETSQKILSYV